MWKRPSLSYWVIHQKCSKEEFVVLEDLKVEKASENLHCGWQCLARGLFYHLHSQLADLPQRYWENQLPHPETGEMC